MRASESSEYEKIFDALDLALLRFITTSKSSSIGTPLYRPKHFGMSESAAYESLRFDILSGINAEDSREAISQ